MKFTPPLTISIVLLLIVLAGLTALAHFRPHLLGLKENPTTVPGLHKLPGYLARAAEASPILVNGKVAVMISHRKGSYGTFIEFLDFETGTSLTKPFKWPYAFASAINDGTSILVFGSKPLKPGSEIGMLRFNHNLKLEQQTVLFTAPETIANTSVIHDGTRYVMALEAEKPTGGQFYPRFMQSADLNNWTPLGKPFRMDEYTACPTLRYANGQYYIFYLASHKLRGDALPHQEYGFTTRLARTGDFENYQTEYLFQLPTILAPEGDEGINASDIDLLEFNGATYITYNVGDQHSIGNLKRATYPGTIAQMAAELWPNN